jgi:hypothetical protein
MSEDKKVEFEQLKQTKGTFEARGILFNLKSEKAFSSKTAKNGKQWRSCDLGLRIADGEVMYLHLNGMEQDFVYFSKPAEKKGEKSTTKKVEWAKRERSQGEGYRLIGVGLALVKDEETGKNEEVKTFTAFDAIKYIEDNAQDGMSVFVKGNIEFSSYEDKNGELKHGTKLVPNAMYRTKEDINFQAEGFEKVAEFALPVVFNAARKDEDKFLIDASIIGFKTIEDVSLETGEGLAKTLKDKVKPFSGVTLTGRIESSQVVDQVPADVWGEDVKVGRARTPNRTVLRIVGARPETINTEDYTKKSVEAYREACEALKKDKKNKESGFESQDAGWGDKGKVQVEESGW